MTITLPVPRGPAVDREPPAHPERPIGEEPPTPTVPATPTAPATPGAVSLPVVPRPYQEQALTALLEAKERGLARVLFTMPTGTGKTNTFAWLIERLAPGRPTLILAHRDELLRQAQERIQGLVPGLKVEVEKGEEVASPHADVVVASIQTLGRASSRRCQWLVERVPEVIICDEAHHAPAESYLRTFQRFGAFGSESYLVGCTATPHRLDTKHLREVFEEEVFRYEFRQAMVDRWLAPVRCYRAVTTTDLSQVGTRQGDYEVGALARAVTSAARTNVALDHWEEVARHRLTLAFCVDLEHARHTSALFRQRGVRSEVVDGEMAMSQRREILGQFSRRELEVISNCAVLTEGYDEPQVAAILMLRPTQSTALYQQMIGRGCRLHPDKDDLVAIDVVDNCNRLRPPVFAPDLIGLPSQLDLGGASLLEAAELFEQLGGAAGLLTDRENLTLDDVRTRLEEFDIFGQITLDRNVQGFTSFAWAPILNGYYLSCGNRRDARITQDTVGDYHLTLRDLNTNWRAEYRLGGLIKTAFGRADHQIRHTWQEAIGLVQRESYWRTQPPTPPQLEILRARGLPERVLRQLSRGDASQAIANRVGQARRRQ